MFFPGTDSCFIPIKRLYKNFIQKTNMFIKKERILFPAARYQKQSDREGIFQFISFKRLVLSDGLQVSDKGSLTLEMTMVLPLFLFAMLAMLQFASIESASSALLSGAQDTAKEMAAYAYIQNMGTEEKPRTTKG